MIDEKIKELMQLNKIYQGDCLEVLKTFPDNSIDCCVTSPPYWGLRDYGHDEQIGNEENFKTFIDKLCNIFGEVKRVLKPEGNCFVNLGDTYSSNLGGNRNGLNNTTWSHAESEKKRSEAIGTKPTRKKQEGVPDKCLMMIPERFAIEMISRGWVLRNQIIWHKPNQMPSSATDRFTVDFEKIFFFVQQPTDYYFEQQKEPSLTYENRPSGVVRDKLYGYDSKQDKVRISLGKKSFSKAQAAGKGIAPSGNGTKDYYEVPFERNMRTVFSINTEPSDENHFATYPQKLVERIIKAGCPENGIVLDCFMGAGTTAVVASKLNRNYIGIELNQKYIAIAKRRLQKELGLFNKAI